MKASSAVSGPSMWIVGSQWLSRLDVLGDGVVEDHPGRAAREDVVALLDAAVRAALAEDDLAGRRAPAASLDWQSASSPGMFCGQHDRRRRA